MGDAGGGQIIGRCDADRCRLVAGGAGGSQSGTAGKCEFGVVGCVYRQGGAFGDLRRHCGDVDAGAHHEHRLRRFISTLEGGDHGLQLGDGVGGVQAVAAHSHHSTVVGTHHRQGGDVPLKKQQCCALRAGGGADYLGQGPGGM